MKKLIHIGTTELVSLPDAHIEAVPAKIDTGADSSAIWATQIGESNGELSFVLFDAPSPFYTGRKITTADYRVTTIKNSFGQSERRYKIHLKVSIAGRTIRSTFTLANRANNRYPLLVGKRTLQGKFLVDASIKSTGRPYDILMLSTKRTLVTEKFAEHLEQYGKKLRITYLAYEALCFSVGGNQNLITIIDSGRDVATFDLVHFKTTFMDITASIARYLQKRRVPYLDQAMQYFPSDSKLYQYSILADNGIPIAPSIFIFPKRLKHSYEYLKDQIGLPFVLKDIHASKGQDNYLIDSEKSFQTACREIAKNDLQCIAQAYIDNECDYRILVFGSKIALVMERSRQDSTTHLNNTSQGGKARLISLSELPQKVRSASVRAAQLMERQVAGVDFIQDKKSGLWYCLEVNAGPQLATGSFTAEKHAAFAAYLERRLTK